MDLSKYADLFLTESREHLSAMNHQLLALERDPADAEPVAAIFRAVHTVKGMSATMGYAAVTELAHELESLLDQLRSGARAVSGDVVDAMFAAVDGLERAIELSVAGREEEASAAPLVARLKSLDAPAPTRKRRKTVARGAAPASAGRLVRVRLAADAVLKGARAMIVLQRAQSLGAVSDVTPPPDALQAGSFDRELTLRLDTTAPAARIVEALMGAGEVESVEVDASGLGTRDSALREGGEGPSLEARASNLAESRVPSPESRTPSSIRIDLRRLDTLMNLIGELVIARGRLAQIASAIGEPVLDDTVAQTSRLIAELQDEIMLSRMVPVGQVFDRFPRLVRDSARALGKQIDFVVEGREIELDRSMLEEIGEPVVHLLRNAVDHGIESPDERLAAGKPVAGRLTLRVERERSTVTIRVSDDGRGIDRARVLERAREQGLVDAETHELSDEELVRVIARPGFSTAARVSNLSGRGVGIDIVMARVRQLGGAVEIRSTPGVGTTVTARMPITLAIVRALLARVSGEVYAVPMTHVNETVELASTEVRRVKGRDVAVMRDDVLPLIRFRDLVHPPAADASPSPQVIVLEMGARRAALVVDELTGQQDIVVKQFDPVREGLPLFSGATILADGAPALIVDVGSLL